LKYPPANFRLRPVCAKQVPLVGGASTAHPAAERHSRRCASLKGIQQQQGGPVYGVDTEAGRMLHYADQFEFMHIPFGEPYGSLDYLAVIRAALKHNTTGKRPTVIIDSMSHEHEGPGGMLELHDQTATRMATYDGKFDPKKYERVKMLAWAEPKSEAPGADQRHVERGGELYPVLPRQGKQRAGAEAGGRARTVGPTPKPRWSTKVSCPSAATISFTNAPCRRAVDARGQGRAHVVIRSWWAKHA
jgi:hypothetical protein